VFDWLIMGKIHLLSFALLLASVAGSPSPIMSNDDPTLLADPNLMVHFYSKENLDRLLQHQQLNDGTINLGSDDFDSLYFQLFSPENGPDRKHIFSAPGSAHDLLQAGFDPNRQTKILIHGFASHADKFAKNFVKAYYSNAVLKNVNIIAVDWRELASAPNYIKAAMDAVAVGDFVGQTFGELLIQDLKVSPMDIHVIGHSLGAHFAGHLARQLAATGNMGKVARVTGLDPAKPYFDVTDISNRIQTSDAHFVDIIHTNSGDMWNGCLSMPTNLGHMDFYPNGGQHQPGCVPLCTPLTCPVKNLVEFLTGGCSHRRSEQLYIESITAANNDNTDFKSRKCDDYEDFTHGICKSKCTDATCAHMGERSEEAFRQSFLFDQKASNLPEGGFFLKTAATAPFSLS